MEIIADNSQALMSFIHHACGCADSRQTGIDSYGFVCFEAKNGKLTITGGNGSHAFIRECGQSGVQAQGDGKLVVEAAKLHSVVRTLPKDKPVVLKAVEGKDRAVVSAGRSRLQLKTIEAKHYPTPEKMAKDHTQLTIPARSLMSLLSDTMYAAGKQDVRPYLNSVMLETKKGMLYAVGSDGHRLCANKHAVDENVAEIKILLPTKAVQIFTRLSEVDETIKVSIDQNRAEFKWGSLIYRTCLVDSQYPDVWRIIPKSCNASVTVNRLEFLSVLSRLQVMVSGEKFPKVKLMFGQDQIQLQTIGTNEEDGLGEDFVSAQFNGYVGFDFGVNPNYLSDALNHLDSDEISLEFTEANASCVVVPVGNSQSRALIMPVRV